MFALSSNWVEVARYSGSAFPEPKDFSTEGFVADHEEWRIRWGYNAVGSSSLESVLIIEKGSDVLVLSSGYSDRSDVRNIHEQKQDFSLYITCVNIYEYTIIIEHDLNSIPEFPLWIILPIFITATLLALSFKKRILSNRKIILIAAS